VKSEFEVKVGRNLKVRFYKVSRAFKVVNSIVFVGIHQEYDIIWCDGKEEKVLENGEISKRMSSAINEIIEDSSAISCMVDELEKYLHVEQNKVIETAQKLSKTLSELVRRGYTSEQGGDKSE